MRRREFIRVLGGTAATWPFAARAQSLDRVKHVGALMNISADDPQAAVFATAFAQGLQQRGWTLGDNVRIDTRWAAGKDDLYRQFAQELIALTPDAILAAGGTAVIALQQVTRAIPIVFVNVSDPVNRGLVASLARPRGNTTGFTQFAFGSNGKWLELLKQVAPKASRVAAIADPIQFKAVGQLAAVQTAAPSLGVELVPIDVSGPEEIEGALRAFARGANGGMIVAASASAIGNRDLITALAAQLRLPAIYAYRYFVSAGGLMSYGPDPADQYRKAAGYVDRILKGESPSELPVEAPKPELVINLKAAKALDLTVPPSLLALADEVIE
jgi:putative tryptophan/tyrosine transport system substrate-binding protein